MPHVPAPVIEKLCSLGRFCELNKSKTFKIWLIVLIVCIVGFQLTVPNMTFYANPFYLGSFISAVALLINSLNYFCPDCKRNQVALSLKQFKLPNNTCRNCGFTFGKSSNS